VRNCFAAAQSLGREKILGTETEVKIKLSDCKSFCRNLQEFNPRVLADRHFEDNCLLDFPDGRLQASRCLVRVRNANGQAFLTYKGAPRADGIFKVREELETRIEFGEITLQILERMGMRLCFRYQKYRHEFEIDEVKVAVDETPIGDYAEFEGSEAAIFNLAQKMKIEPSLFLRASYYSLYVEYCNKRGETPGFMIF
jgi:predicted adenylyl cyclase CyaB